MVSCLLVHLGSLLSCSVLMTTRNAAALKHSVAALTKLVERRWRPPRAVAPGSAAASSGGSDGIPAAATATSTSGGSSSLAGAAAAGVLPPAPQEEAGAAAAAAGAGGGGGLPPWDVICGSDLIYYTYSEATPHSRLLLAALRQLAAPSTLIVLSLSLHHNPEEVRGQWGGGGWGGV